VYISRSRRFRSLLLILCLSALAATAEPRDRNTQDGGRLDDIQQRLIRFVKKLPVPHLPKIFDEPGIPKP